MEDRTYLEKRRKTIEKVVLIIYSVYTLAMAAVSIALNWNPWVEIFILLGMTVCWIVYSKEARSYEFRAFFMSAAALMNIVVYSAFADNYAGLLPVFCAMVILLAVLGIPQIISLVTFSFVLMTAYHALVRGTIPFSTLGDRIRSMTIILSVFTLLGVTYYLLKIYMNMQQKLLETIEDLKSAEHSKSDFLANMSHEIRTPINTICGMSEMLLREDIEESIRGNLFNIQTAGRSLLSIVSDVLDFSELESGKMGLDEEPYNLTSTINDVINMAIAQKGSKKLELIVDCDAKIPYTLLGDEQKLRRVMLSFVNNAIKFTEAGCIAVVISARKEGYGVNLTVTIKDTGIGITMENQEKLFSSFSQVDTKRNRQEGGIGIGLAIAKDIISKMGGFINVKSTLGKGSEFRFVVPQKVIDDRPMVSVKEPENLNVITYINSEKYDFAEIRDDYLASIRHMAEGLEVRYQYCRNLAEFKRRMEKEIYTHVFITADEYKEDKEYFDKLTEQVTVILVQDREHVVHTGSSIRVIYKPFYVLSIASVLNGDHVVQRLDGSHYQEKKFVAPDARVLVVDDNLMNLKVVEGLLRPYKIKVFVATSGKEALDKLDNMVYDIIFMDHMMPEMDGVETAHNIRRKPGTYFQNVPIVALTANAIGGAREMFLSEGFQDYVAKPIDLSCLERVLRKYIPEEKLQRVEEMDVILPEEKPQPDRETRPDKESQPDKGDQGAKAEPKPETSGRIDRQKGIQYCGGDEKDYEEVLEVYHSVGFEKIKEIQQKYEERNWKNYTILVHALKSTSIGIGAAALGEMAKELEAAGREERISYIAENHEAAMREYEEVLKEIGGMLTSSERETDSAGQQNKAKAAEGDMDTEMLMPLSEEEQERHFGELSALLDTFEMEASIQKLEELSAYSYDGKPLAEYLKTVREKVEQFDFCGAAEEIAKLGEKGGSTSAETVDK